MPAAHTVASIAMLQCSVLAEIEWNFGEAGDQDINWKFLNQEATFSHKEACEFILHIGTGSEDQHSGHVIHKMKEFGCTDDFINAYIAAEKAGATRVMFWA